MYAVPADQESEKRGNRKAMSNQIKLSEAPGLTNTYFLILHKHVSLMCTLYTPTFIRKMRSMLISTEMPQAIEILSPIVARNRSAKGRARGAGE